MKTRFLSRRDVERISADPQYYLSTGAIPAVKVALLSFVSPDGFGGTEVTEPKLDSYWFRVFKQRFHDIDPSKSRAAIVQQYVLFDEQQAEDIIEFLLEVEDETQEIWTHCEAGVSRSAAVAKYISYAYGCMFPESYSLYNRHVFSTLVKAHNKRSYDGRPYPGQRFQKDCDD